MFDKLRLKVSEIIETTKLRNERDRELREIHSEHKFEGDIEKLDREIEIEERRSELRVLKSENVTTVNPNQPKVKSAFDSFRDFATDFTERQQGYERKNKTNGGKINGNTPKDR